MNKSLTVLGIREIDAALGKLETKLQRKVLRSAMRKSMQPLAANIRDNFPRDTGETAQEIKVRAGKGRRGDIVIDVRGNNNNFIPKFIEFGTVDSYGKQLISPNPVFRQTYDSMGDAARRQVQQEILSEIERANRK